MDPTWLVLASIAFGVVVGASAVVIITVAAARGRQAVAVVSPSVPDGVEQVIDALESGGVVLDPSNNVIKASPGAVAFGLVWNHALVHPELVEIVDEVRRGGEAVARELELPRGRSERRIFTCGCGWRASGPATFFCWRRTGQRRIDWMLCVATSSRTSATN